MPLNKTIQFLSLSFSESYLFLFTVRTLPSLLPSLKTLYSFTLALKSSLLNLCSLYLSWNISLSSFLKCFFLLSTERLSFLFLFFLFLSGYFKLYLHLYLYFSLPTYKKMEKLPPTPFTWYCFFLPIYLSEQPRPPFHLYVLHCLLFMK